MLYQRLPIAFPEVSLTGTHRIYDRELRRDRSNSCRRWSAVAWRGDVVAEVARSSGRLPSAPLLNLGQALLQTLKLQTNLRLHGGL